MSEITEPSSNDINTQSFKKVNVKGEFPQLYSIAVEHLSTCKECAKKVAAHHVGVGKIADDEQMINILDTTEAGITQLSTGMETINKLISESHNLIKETHDVIVSLNKIETIADEAFSRVLNKKIGSLSKLFKAGGVGGWVIIGTVMLISTLKWFVGF